MLTSSVSGATVSLPWTAPAGATSYWVEVGSASGVGNIGSVNVGEIPSIVATGIGAGTYYVRIRAANSCGTGPPSNERVVTVQ